MSLREQALHMHRINKGKLETVSKVEVKNAEDLSLAYSPGVAEPCKDIYDKPELVYDYTMKGNTVAVVSDGTAVLGLGNIGPEAALPVIREIARSSRHYNLGGNPTFNANYMEQMLFPFDDSF